jgi:hypothetical protein
LNISVLVDLSSFNYVQIISMILWNDDGWNVKWFKVFECELRLRFKLYKVEW